MKTTLLISTASGLSVAGSSFAQEGKEEAPAGVVVEPAGVRAIWHEAEDGEFGHFGILNGNSPTAVALKLKTEEKKIVSIDEGKSKLTTFSDDKGGKLRGDFGSFPRVAEDGRSAIVEINGKKGVSPGSRLILAQGTIQLMVASKTASARSKLIDAKEGSKLEIAEDTVFEIKKVGKPDWGDDPMMVELEIKRDISDIANFRFFDAEGQEIEASNSGSSYSGIGRRVTVGRDFVFKRKVDKFILEIDRWTDMEKASLPFDFKIGIGGPE